MTSTDPAPSPEPAQTPPHGDPPPRYAAPAYDPAPGAIASPAQAPLPAPASAAPTLTARGGVNGLGIAALSLLALLSFLSLLAPLLYRQAAIIGDYSLVAGSLTGLQFLVVLVAIGLAIGGVLQRSAPRLRWTAIGSLVSGALSLASMLFGTLGGWLATALPY
ncbi:hypothetical protein J4H92_02450 [Leucobacter weissii]|uniref:Uncharacterized protein n=1 Tax=Leucobacter weissii TaxID=1983706 RepID=A0A939S7B1_9MICO|nr:hypothetical protein [Leucobacter weissii]MBO1900806.1 hypothetical protein [Leucobacter weissii]